MILNLSIHIFLVQNDRTTDSVDPHHLLVALLCTESYRGMYRDRERALKGVLATTQPCSLLHIRQIKSRFVHHDYNHLSELNGWNWVFCRGYLSAIFYQRIELSRGNYKTIFQVCRRLLAARSSRRRLRRSIEFIRTHNIIRGEQEVDKSSELRSIG